MGMIRKTLLVFVLAFVLFSSFAFAQVSGQLEGSSQSTYCMFKDTRSSEGQGYIAGRNPMGSEQCISYCAELRMNNPWGSQYGECRLYPSSKLSGDFTILQLSQEATIVKEQVKCVFTHSSTTQKCYTDDGKFGCSGLLSCIADVQGGKGEKLTWKSTCHEYAYTTIDAQNEYAVFYCKEQASERCIDSDGMNAGTQGTIIYTHDDGSQVQEADYCEGEHSVIEGFCKGPLWNKQTVPCPDGCKDGACLSTLVSSLSPWGQKLGVKGVNIPEGSFREFVFKLDSNGNPPLADGSGLIRPQIVVDEPYFNYAYEGDYGYANQKVSNNLAAYFVGKFTYGNPSPPIEFDMSNPQWDVARLYIDGKLVNTYGGNSGKPVYIQTFLGGTHIIEIEYDSNWHAGTFAARIGRNTLPGYVSATTIKSTLTSLEQQYSSLKVMGASVYESPDNINGDIQLILPKLSQPTVLVLSSYDPVRWRWLQNSPDTIQHVKAIIAYSFAGSATVDQVSGIPVHLVRNVYIDMNQAKLEAQIGKKIDSFATGYAPSSLTFPEIIPNYVGLNMKTDKTEYTAGDVIYLKLSPASDKSEIVDLYITTPFPNGQQVRVSSGISVDKPIEYKIDTARYAETFSTSGTYGLLVCNSGEKCIGGINTNSISVYFKTITPTCTDPDGIDYYTQGVVVWYDQPSGKFVQMTDNCEYDNDTVNEYVCEAVYGNETEPDRVYGRETEFQCPNGCEDGACKRDCDIEDGSLMATETASYFLDGTNYKISIDDGDESAIVFLVNGMLTDRMKVGSSYMFQDGSSIILDNIQTEGDDRVGFCFRKGHQPSEEITCSDPDSIIGTGPCMVMSDNDYNDLTPTDSCPAGKNCFVQERYCTLENKISVYGKGCANGCKDGACIFDMSGFERNFGELEYKGVTRLDKCIIIKGDDCSTTELVYTHPSEQLDSAVVMIENHGGKLSNVEGSLRTEYAHIGSFRYDDGVLVFGDVLAVWQSNNFLISLYLKDFNMPEFDRGLDDSIDELLHTLRVRFPPTINTESCTDSDGGKDYYQYGETKGISPSDGEFYSGSDKCGSDTNPYAKQGQLIEHYCDGNYHTNAVVTCENGCKDGACMATAPIECSRLNGYEDLCVQQPNCKTAINWLKPWSPNCVSIDEVTNEELPSYNKGITVSEQGNVGIGTTTPGAKLHVYGTSGGATSGLLQAADANGVWIEFNNTENRWQIGMNADEDFAIWDGTSGGNYRLIVMNGTGNVGIGTTNPGNLLDVAGQFRASNASIPTAASSGTGVEVYYRNDLSAGYIISYDRTGGTYKNLTIGPSLRLDANGNVGIGTPTPSQRLEVTGNVKLNKGKLIMTNAQGSCFECGPNDVGAWECTPLAC